MVYCTDYKVLLPYSRWYDDLSTTQKHIQERFDEIKKKYAEPQKANDAYREQEYAKNEEDGLIFDQHYDISLDIRKRKNTELIGLISEIKSCIEKVLRDMIREYRIEEPKQGFISNCINLLEQQRKIDMSPFARQKRMIDLLNKDRNSYEHEKDNLFFDKDADYMQNSIRDCFFFMKRLIEKLYEASK